jgi:signal transduction histidine kinase
MLNIDAEMIHLQVKDNGCGIPATKENTEPGLGLIAMQERVQLVGGKLTLNSPPMEPVPVLMFAYR